MMMVARENALDLLCRAYKQQAWTVEDLRRTVDQWMTDAYEAGRKDGCPICNAQPQSAPPSESVK